jgi:hypothetical protein
MRSLGKMVVFEFEYVYLCGVKYIRICGKAEAMTKMKETMKTLIMCIS